jgi:Ca2+-binding EF-hand superfamily protein
MLCIWFLWAVTASAIKEDPPADNGEEGPPADMEEEGPPPDMEEEGPPPDMEEEGPPADMEEEGPPEGKGKGKGKGKGTDYQGEYNPMCDPDSDLYDPTASKCSDEVGEEIWEDEYGPGEMSEEEQEEIMGDGTDSMTEEMADADDGPNFSELDANGDEFIDPNEAAAYGTVNSIPMGQIQEIFKYMDADSDGLVSRAEFESPGADQATEDMAPTLGDCDLNGDGVMESAEWAAACECPDAYLDTCGSPEMCQDMFDLADDDKDGVVTQEEFDGAGEECITADDGDCDAFFAAGKGKATKVSLAKWLRKHFKHTGRNLLALAKLRAQHKKGEFVKLTDLIAKRHLAHRRQRKQNGKASKQNGKAGKVHHSFRQRGHRGNARRAQHLRQKGLRGNARRAQHLRHGGHPTYQQLLLQHMHK